MPTYSPPLRDMQFVLHELLHAVDTLRQIPRHAEIDADTCNAVLEAGGTFAREVVFPLNASGDTEGCKHDPQTHAVQTPQAFGRPTSNTSQTAGRRWLATRPLAARACRWC